MITAKELRIGNLINLYVDEQTNEVIEVTLSTLKYLIMGTEKDTYIFSPIRLTKQWLLKLGCEYVNTISLGGTECWRYKDFHFQIDNTNKITISETLRIISSVHDFQNYILAMTGKELEIQ